jgi:hypothetical protein
MGKKSNIIECRLWAANKGGKCLENIYKGTHVKMLWECSLGHQWRTPWHNIKDANSWCPKCARNLKPDISVCQDYAKKEHSGKCIETTYVNAHYKMLWECSKGHKWKATWNSINSGNKWCAICARNVKPTIEECCEYVKNEHNGRCCNTIYVNSHVRMLWECSEGHQWKTNWNGIKNKKTWCPVCANKSKPSVEECNEYVTKKYNGKCLEKVYVNNETRMLWECSKGHQWRASWGNLHIGNKWCPECSSFKTEHKCKELLEQKLGFELKKTNFKCESNCYQWDGYNEEHKIAFEYHGYQHYEYPNYWHKTLAIYEKAIQRDLDKVQYAKENNIRLIIIPYTEEKNLEEYISKYIIS